ncbi:MAG TPA: DUF4850 domain-containing protein [Dyella sp.]|uniref:DUF4850 domain-containing protein n=1 Tax=Dyella sp. TaxID=1869338 RepID=UPI002D77BBC2|nr:DUF4850 domain-containing protein [Dyella sp.]HET6553001.1 DUF4850 domain-containing protein [Dyella sp.]
MRVPRVYKALLGAVLCCMWFTAHADTAVRELRSAPEARSAPGIDYTLHTTMFQGSTVMLIDVHTGTGDWIRTDATRLPPFPLAPPAKAALQWFFGATVGWMPVPAGWRLQRAAVGADGNTAYTFASPDGVASGWVTYTVVPACESCILQDANGVLPGAGEHLDASGAGGANLGQTNPVMSWQSHPDDCTAMFRYRSDGLTVHAAVLSSVPISALDSQKGDLSLAEAYVALPSAKAADADFLLSHFRRAFPACHAPNGWAG